jgi:MFS family permease
MKHALAPVAALLISVAILMTGLGLQGTLLPVRASLEHFSTLAIGAMGASYFLGFTVGCLKGGELVKNVGHVRVFLAMTALGSAAPLIHGLILNPLAWSLLRFLTGFCFAVLFVVIESWLNERSSNADRGFVFSTYVMITLTVIAAGQMTTLLYDPQGLELFVIASVLVSLGAVPVALSTSATPEQPHEVQLDLRRLLRISPAGSLGCLVAGISQGAFWSLSPVFVSAYESDVSLAAWFMAASVLGGGLAQWPLGYISDKLGRRETLFASASAAAVVGAVIVASADQLGIFGLSLLGAAWGAVAFPIYSIAVANANDHADPRDYVMVSSGLLLLYGTGAIVGPFAASALMTVIGAAGLYAMASVVHVLLAAYVLLRLFRGATVPDEQHIAFGDALATAYSASQIYEEEIMLRAEEEGIPDA